MFCLITNKISYKNCFMFVGVFVHTHALALWFNTQSHAFAQNLNRKLWVTRGAHTHTHTHTHQPHTDTPSQWGSKTCKRERNNCVFLFCALRRHFSMAARFFPLSTLTKYRCTIRSLRLLAHCYRAFFCKHVVYKQTKRFAIWYSTIFYNIQTRKHYSVYSLGTNILFTAWAYKYMVYTNIQKSGAATSTTNYSSAVV